MATENLTSPPRSAPLLAKAALGLLPGLRRRGTELPDTELVLADVRADADHLAAYSRVCGFGTRDELPATYPHVLAFPLTLRLLTDGSFPFPMIGLVHLGNVITVSRPLRRDEAFTLRIRTADLRPHDRGTQFDLIHEATVGGELVWRDVSTYLRRSSSGSRDARPRESSPRSPEEAPTAVWHVPEDTGRRYAAVSGDRNPIHLHPLAARAFGFRRAIAHGMWTKARCLAALEGSLPATYTVEVSFKLPIFLPAKVAFTADGADGGWRFGVRDARSGKPHLTGTITPG
jgi:acyl dehydratase